MATDEDFGVPHVYWEITLHSGTHLHRIIFPFCGLPRIGEVVCLQGLPELEDRVEDEPSWYFVVTNVTWKFNAAVGTVVPTVYCAYDSRDIREIRRELFEQEGWQAFTD